MFTIKDKQQLSQLSSALKAVFEQRYNFPIKLSRAREAASQLVSGLNHQNLLKQLPLDVKHFNIEALSDYLKKVHQKTLSEEAVKEWDNDGLQELLIAYSPDIFFAEKTQEAVVTDTVMCLFGVYTSRFETFDEDEHEVDVPFNLIELLEKKFGTRITDLKAEILSPQDAEGGEIAEFWASLKGWEPDESELYQSFTLPSGPFSVKPSEISNGSDETWVLEVPRFILAVAIKTTPTKVTPEYDVYTQYEGILGAISSEICQCEFSTESAVFIEAAYLPVSFQDINEDFREISDDELSYYFWDSLAETTGQQVFGDNSYGGCSFDYESTGFCTTYRALSIIKQKVSSGQFGAATFPIASTGDNWGTFGFLCLEQNKDPILAMSHFETFSCDHGSMSTSSHHFEGKHIIRNLFPNIQCYSIAPMLREDGDSEARWFSGVWEVLELWQSNDIQKYLYTQKKSNIDYEHGDNVLIQPSLFNAFNELIKHWVAGNIDPSDPTIYSPSKPLFETRRDELLNAGLDFIQVTDFQELYGDHTSVLTVSLYAGQQLLAELSYAVMLGAGENQDPVEWQLDEAIRQFAAENSIKLRWQEYTVIHPFASRNLSFYKSQSTLMPVPRDMSIKESMLIMVVNIKAPEYHESVKLDQESLYNLSYSLLKNNSSRNGTPIPFFFSLLGHPNKFIPGRNEIETLIESLSSAIASQQKIIDDVPELPDGINTRGYLSFYSAFDLSGKPFDEVHTMISNTGARFRFEKATPVDTTNEVTEHWTSPPTIGDKFYVSEGNLPEWESALGYIPSEVEFVFLPAKPLS
ncbi:hypothetical protein VCRA2110O2_30087 [Vibrio crassostreae]|nr:hypothetical protein VCHA44O286_50290 [Vibrio chagasii]CAK2847674.1 hypothetical protein VCRA2110O2_30087 [Vibrio crassostreae]